MCQMYFVLKMSEPTPTHQHQSSSLAKERSVNTVIAMLIVWVDTASASTDLLVMASTAGLKLSETKNGLVSNLHVRTVEHVNQEIQNVFVVLDMLVNTVNPFALRLSI
ncbi:PREDICTED: uncharacterized protein LOC107330519 [Acropora digitifera]|uniref:uncharacterized protein LOC107330519 n=1 Tax=Acropora digitifera TaxID=70779 RepID=UPI00077AFA10|nr:PREDICTED: uncharacterized protein LOC107330519 [Acropora digitifera]